VNDNVLYHSLLRMGPGTRLIHIRGCGPKTAPIGAGYRRVYGLNLWLDPLLRGTRHDAFPVILAGLNRGAAAVVPRNVLEPSRRQSLR